MQRWMTRLAAWLPTVVLTIAWLGVAVSPSSAGTTPRVHARPVVRGLSQPVAFTFGPGRKLWYVEKTTGEVRIHDLDTGADRRFVRVRAVNGSGERGMLGIALHPEFPGKPFVYVYATRNVDGGVRNQILRYRADHGRGTGRKIVLSIVSASTAHNGGRIAFGPDGMLYAVVGENTDPSNAQDRSNEDRGKILRIAPNGDVPSDNPFDDAVWAFGIRNSFGFAFDPRTGALWETENGPECNDEINLVGAGDNLGWGPNETCGGSSPANTNQDGPNPVLPKLVYENTIGITGIAFCDGCGLGHRSEGAAFVGAVNTGDVTRVLFDGRRDGIDAHSVVYHHDDGTLSFEVGPGGRIYFSDFGAIYRLVRT